MGLAEVLVRGVAEHRRAIDDTIERISTNWRLDRMAKVDRNVLRLAVYELLRTDVPVKVVINEAIELGKKFGSESSGAFVNGVLDRVAAELPAERRRERP
jgi:N utilization substance protein B